MKKAISLSAFIKVDRINEVGLAPIFIRISTLNSKTTLNLDIFVNPKIWRNTKQLKLSRLPSDLLKREQIDEICKTLISISDNLTLKGKVSSALTIKDIYQSGNVTDNFDQIMLMDLFEIHISNFSKLVENKTRAQESLRKYKTLKNHVVDFLNVEFDANDFPLKELNFGFIESFDLFLRSVKNIGNNTTVKYVQAFSGLMNVAIKYDWLEKDPFVLYENKIIVKDPIWLTQEELHKMEFVDLPGERLEVVRDLFVFGCYTGYAPVDIDKLKYTDISMGNDGQKWIFTSRTKTGVKSDVPLLPKAEQIIESYRTHPYCLTTGHILPKRSSQKANEYLKEVAIHAGISKKLNMYVSRFTFGCTVILANGLSLEVLSKLLGHKNIKMTEHYGKIQNARVSEEMKALKEKLSKGK